MTDFKDTLFIFTTSPTGLGHIRVMDSIKDGMPSGISTIDLGITNIRASMIHEIGSRVLPFIKLTEFYQTNKLAENLVTFFYTIYLRKNTKKIIENLEIAKKSYPDKKNWVIISTHFALAHSISAGKNELEKKLGIKIFLCVVVTDDSPQRVWAVEGSDLTFVASNETKQGLEKYFPLEKRDNIKTISFPLSPRLTQTLSTTEFQFVIDQLSPNGATQIEIPISGAAVQLPFFEKFINILCRENYTFTVTGQESQLTKDFFDNVRQMPRVQVSIGKDAWQSVEYYESLFYQSKRPSIEITKPSEQAFKAILDPRQRGGVILLLTQPVGRQEYDNLKFLERNGLLPNETDHKELYNDEDLSVWKEKAKNWRAIKIPTDPVKAADFVKKLKAGGVLYSMLSCVVPNKEELQSNGVARIWEEISLII